MKKPVKVRVQWATAKLKKPPQAKTYSTVARFPEDMDWPNSAWSIVLQFESVESVREGNATAYFLVDEAPHERLKPGAVFTLYEGLTPTATVTVIR